MIRVVRYRPARPEERLLHLVGLVPEVSLFALERSEVTERLNKAVERGELESALLATVDTAVPLAVLQVLGYSEATLQKAEVTVGQVIRKAATSRSRDALMDLARELDRLAEDGLTGR